MNELQTTLKAAKYSLELAIAREHKQSQLSPDAAIRMYEMAIERISSVIDAGMDILTFSTNGIPDKQIEEQ